MCDTRPLQRQERERNEREKTEVKQVLRSMIEANGNKMTVKDIMREYRMTEGCDVPLRTLQYDSLLELIRDMDDTFGVEIRDEHRFESDYVLYCKSDPNTKHIVDFVQNQKNAERNVELLNPLLNGGYTSRSYKNNPRLKTIKPFKLNSNLNTNEDNDTEVYTESNTMPSLSAVSRNHRIVKRAVCPLPDSRVISNGEKNKIYELLDKYTSLNLLNFEVIYKIHHKKAIDFKQFGFETLGQFLFQMPEVVKMYKTPDGIRVQLIDGIKSNGMTNGFTKIKDVTNGLTKPSLVTNGVPKINGVSNRLAKINSLMNALTKVNGVTKEFDKTNGVTNGLPKVSHKQRHFIKQQDLKEMISILRNHPNGIPVHQFISEYEKRLKKPFVSDVWGYGSPIEMFANIREVFYLQKPTDNTSEGMEKWVLMESTPQLRAKTPTIALPKRKKFESEFIRNVNHLMLKISRTSLPNKDLTVEQFPEAYYVQFNQHIDPKTYGFDNFKQLLLSLSRECDFEYKERVKSRPFIVYNKKFYD